MKKIIKSVSIIIILVVMVVITLNQVSYGSTLGTIYAEGGLTVDWDGMPFYEPEFMPGDKAVKQIVVRNNSSSYEYRVGVRIHNPQEFKLAKALSFSIYDSKTHKRIFYRHQLRWFYIVEHEQFIMGLDPGEERKLDLVVEFEVQHDDEEYMDESTEFDFSIGFIGHPRLIKPPRPTNTPQPTRSPSPTRPPRR